MMFVRPRFPLHGWRLSIPLSREYVNEFKTRSIDRFLNIQWTDESLWVHLRWNYPHKDWGKHFILTRRHRFNSMNSLTAGQCTKGGLLTISKNRKLFKKLYREKPKGLVKTINDSFRIT